MDNALLSAIRDLTLGVRHQIRNVRNAEQAEEILAHLDENDDNFPKYEIVRWMRQQLQDTFGTTIEQEIENHVGGRPDLVRDEDTLCKTITEKLLQSSNYRDASSAFRSNTTECVNELLKNFDQEFSHALSSGNASELFGGAAHDLSASASYNSYANTQYMVSGSGSTSTRGSSAFGFSSGEQSEASTPKNFAEKARGNAFFPSHHDSVMFVTPKQLQEIAENLDKKNTVVQRRKAMLKLCKTSMLDSEIAEHWNLIKQGVLDCLCDVDEVLGNLSLRFVAKSCSTITSNTRGCYITLVDYLCDQFQSKTVVTSVIPRVKAGVDLHNHDVVHLLKAFRLLDDLAFQVCRVWIRFPVRCVEEIIDAVLGLFTIADYSQHGSSDSSEAHMTPLHFMALTDPRAIWFAKWMHSHFSRSIVLRLLRDKYRSLIADAVQVCFSFAQTLKRTRLTNANTSPSKKKAAIADGARAYAPEQVQYVHFLHAFSMLTRLLCYQNGRSCFPIVVSDANGSETVTIEQLLVCFAEYLTSHLKPGLNASKNEPVRRTYLDLGSIVTDTFRRFVMNLNGCPEQLRSSELFNVLLEPIRILTERLDEADRTQDDSAMAFGSTFEHGLLQVAEIVCTFAVNDQCRKFILEEPIRDGFTAIQLIANFVVRSLHSYVRSSRDSGWSKVVGSYLYIVRQFYSCSSGLHILMEHGLFALLVKSWQKASQAAQERARQQRTALSQLTPEHFWEAQLTDNLLNVCWTAYGVHLLQQTNVFSSCVAYMFERYVSKKQVGKCEKFGFGRLIAMISPSAKGIRALNEAGFVSAYMQDAWNVLEYGLYSNEAEQLSVSQTMLKGHFSDGTAANKTIQKLLLNLLHILSSHDAVAELLLAESSSDDTARAPLSDARITVTSLSDFLDRTLLIDDPAKQQALFSYDRTHLFALRLLSNLVSNLDVCLLLQSRLRFHEVLLQCQAQNVNEPEEGERTLIIVDELSIERNLLLVKVYSLGGPSERLLPRLLGPSDYPHPMFSEYPVPAVYFPEIRKIISMPFAAVVHSCVEKAHKLGSLNSRDLKQVFFKYMPVGKEIRGVSEAAAMDQVAAWLEMLVQSDGDRHFSVGGSQRDVSLTDVDKYGVQLICDYGSRLRLLRDRQPADCKKALKSVIREVRIALGVDDDLMCFDWFVGVLFLIMRGDANRCTTFLLQFARSQQSGLIWPQRFAYNKALLPKCVLQSGLSPLFSVSGHCAEMIVEQEFPEIFCAFKMSGFTVAQICVQWLRQLFLNALDFAQICEFVTICVTGGPPFGIFFCVAVIKSLERKILEHELRGDLVLLLREKTLIDFDIQDYWPLVLTLHEKYTKKVSEQIEAVFSDSINF